MTASIQVVHVGFYSMNCYLVSNPETNELFIVDPGDDPERIIAAIGTRAPAAILLTHGHFDHIGACDALCGKYKLPLYLHEADVPLLTDPRANASSSLGGEAVMVRAVPIPVRDGQKLTLAGMEVSVLSTPGHTAGSICYLLPEGQGLFCGDTLFAGGYGRTDLPGGSFLELKASLRKLFVLSPRQPAYPGHGDATTTGRDKEESRQ